jgi:hypothetical protein
MPRAGQRKLRLREDVVDADYDPGYILGTVTT